MIEHNTDFVNKGDTSLSQNTGGIKMLFIFKTENGTFEITSFIKNIKEDGVSTLQLISPYVKSDDLILEGDEMTIQVAYTVIENIRVGSVVTLDTLVETIKKAVSVEAYTSYKTNIERTRSGSRECVQEQPSYGLYRKPNPVVQGMFSQNDEEALAILKAYQSIFRK